MIFITSYLVKLTHLIRYTIIKTQNVRTKLQTHFVSDKNTQPTFVGFVGLTEPTFLSQPIARLRETLVELNL